MDASPSLRCGLAGRCAAPRGVRRPRSHGLRACVPRTRSQRSASSLNTRSPAPPQAKQNSLYVLHDVDTVKDATQVCDGLYLGGWTDARPKVADSTLAEGRFKFFLGSTEWDAGQLEDEFRAGAWLAMDVDPSVVIKDRVLGWKPGQPKPVWTEVMKHLGDEAATQLVEQVYPIGDS